EDPAVRAGAVVVPRVAAAAAGVGGVADGLRSPGHHGADPGRAGAAPGVLFLYRASACAGRPSDRRRQFELGVRAGRSRHSDVDGPGDIPGLADGVLAHRHLPAYALCVQQTFRRLGSHHSMNTPRAEPIKLYTSRQVWIADVVSLSLLGGAILMAVNCVRLGNRAGARVALSWGVVGTAALLAFVKPLSSPSPFPVSSWLALFVVSVAMERLVSV